MSKLDRYIIGAAITAIIVFLIWYFSNIVGYILIAAVLSLIGKPLVDLLCRIHIGRFVFPKWLAATVTLGLLFGVGYAGIYLFVPLIFDKAASLADYNVSNITQFFEQPIQKLEHLLQRNLSEPEQDVSLAAFFGDQLTDLVNLSVAGITSLINRITGFVIAVFSILFITFFFLKEDKLFINGVLLLFPDKYDSNIRRALDSTINLLSRYFIGLFVESLIKLAFITLGLYLLGITFQNALIIALISAILNVIPYIGPLLGAVIGIVIGLTDPAAILSENNLILQMVIVFTLFQVLDNIILQPYVYSSSVKAHPLEIFLVILAAGSIAGVTGMLLAIPAYTVLRVFAKEFFNHFRVVQKLTENI